MERNRGWGSRWVGSRCQDQHPGVKAQQQERAVIIERADLGWSHQLVIKSQKRRNKRSSINTLSLLKNKLIPKPSPRPDPQNESHNLRTLDVPSKYHKLPETKIIPVVKIWKCQSKNGRRPPSNPRDLDWILENDEGQKEIPGGEGNQDAKGDGWAELSALCHQDYSPAASQLLHSWRDWSA